VVGDLLGFFDGTAAVDVGGDAGGPEGMAAGGVGQAAGFGAALDRARGFGLDWASRGRLADPRMLGRMLAFSQGSV
jgi:hypothetical protein